MWVPLASKILGSKQTLSFVSVAFSEVLWWWDGSEGEGTCHQA